MLTLTLFCVYVAVTYSFFRGGLEQGAPMKLAMFIATIWPLLLTVHVTSAIFSGIRELRSRK